MILQDFPQVIAEKSQEHFWIHWYWILKSL